MTEQNIQPRILLIGDTCVDEYRYGVVERISPEAPVPVFKLSDVELKSGMASNVEKNLKALGCNVISYYGDSSYKTRLIDKKSKQHLIRIDDDVISKPLTIDDIKEKDFDAIVISDYNKGAVTYKLIEDLKNSFKDLPIFIDTKKQSLDLFDGCFVKINELEYEKAKSYNNDLIVTMGDKGARYKNVTYPASRVEVSDVTGAGDTFLSALTYQYLNTKSISDAIQFALKASSITVQHMGCYAPTLEEICD